LNAAYGIAFGVVGALIVSRLRRNRIGWLLLVIALAIAAVGTLQTVLEQRIRGTAAPSFVTYLAAWLSGWSWWLLIGPVLLLLLLFRRAICWPSLALGGGMIALLFVAFMGMQMASPEWQDPVSGRTFPNPLGVSPTLSGGLRFETIQVRGSSHS